MSLKLPQIGEEAGVTYILCEKSFYSPDYTVWRYRRCNVETGTIEIAYVAILGGNSNANFIKLLTCWNRTTRWVYGPV
jgi:hypothetical protein